MKLGQAAETECDAPCTGDASQMCGGTWRNSVYRISTMFWEMPGFDDSNWANAMDLGPNGIAPWRKRPRISSKARWIWSTDPNAHDHVFCRLVQPNTEMNCPAAQAQYLHEHPRVKGSGFPAWQHYNKEGKALGFIWHEDLCNVCTPAQMESKCEYRYPWQDGGGGDVNNAHPAGSTPDIVGPFGGALCHDNECSNKCVGKHDASLATLVGAVAAENHDDHYGRGFVDFVNPTSDSVTFTLDQCQAGRHLLEITYSLASDADGGRPLAMTVNGGSYGQGGRTEETINFPATGSWEEWSTVSTRVDLVAGTNVIALAAISNSGPNIDTIELYPNGDQRIGHFHGNLDNSGTVYVNNQAIGGPAGTAWDQTSSFTFSEPCDVPTVYAVHAQDGGRDEDGANDVGGIVGTFIHCNEVINTRANWKCIAADMSYGGQPNPAWNEPAFDDSQWEKAHNYGHSATDDNYWNEYTTSHNLPHIPSDGVDQGAQWIWTSDKFNHDDIFCRYVSHHTFVNCRQAADQYLEDNDDVKKSPQAAWDHFNDYGKFEGRIWHSEKCWARCDIETVAFDWIDTQATGVLATPGDMKRNMDGYGDSGTVSGADAGDDDSYFEVELPFAFPFYGQVKRKVQISTNGYLTFSGASIH
jgi:hypothetical protein